MAKTFKQLIVDMLQQVDEIYPWDLEEILENDPNVLLLDIRETKEFERCHIKGSLHVPRGILETACDWDYPDTEPELVKARDRRVIVICRSGNRSVPAVFTMQLMGYKNIVSVQTGVKGWNDSDFPLINDKGEAVDPDWADGFLTPPIREEQLSKHNP
ncbi:MAG TPA: rhodanese-like domain-containing protein [Leucothrix mucor]|uniref:Rhodanese-like domain-containing protein n=1 Tax=Leucothrix mucor TaxID=45248 RepID=A0A7V2T3N3_LEUMU|nr:rhodanese-like domain-containing protein [Leucothrix mucor]